MWYLILCLLVSFLAAMLSNVSLWIAIIKDLDAGNGLLPGIKVSGWLSIMSCFFFFLFLFGLLSRIS